MEPEVYFIEKCRKDFLTAIPGAFWYKIPDGEASGKRPFDVFAVAFGVPLCLEFKAGSTVTLYQQISLDRAAKNGAYSRLIEPKDWTRILNEILKFKPVPKSKNRPHP